MGLETFRNRNLVIATMHAKEQVIAPIMESELKVYCTTISDLDTDVLGTFTGEVERVSDPISTARFKCLLALELCDADLAIASEGSFGAHPDIFFAKANEEIVMLLDVKHGLEIVGKFLTTETNFDGKEVNSIPELHAFAESVQFPEHALIMRSGQNKTDKLIKGIKDFKTLEKSWEDFRSQFGSVWVETDMRAMFNPTRMKAIQNAALRLIENIKSICPVCDAPGFVSQQADLGLPCSLCNRPTRSVLSLYYSCLICFYSENRSRPDARISEDPMYCDFCNP